MCLHTRTKVRTWPLVIKTRCVECGFEIQSERKDAPPKVLPTLHPLFLGRQTGQSLNGAQQAVVRRLRGEMTGMCAAKLTGVNRLTIYKYWRRMCL